MKYIAVVILVWFTIGCMVFSFSEDGTDIILWPVIACVKVKRAVAQRLHDL